MNNKLSTDIISSHYIFVSTFKAISSLKNMVNEMLLKDLDIHRITKIISLLTKAGVTYNSFPYKKVYKKIIEKRYNDGGWICISDTIWNLYFAKLIEDSPTYKKGIMFLKSNKTKEKLWGRYNRDRNRIPITGLIFFLFPEIIEKKDIENFIELWKLEFASLTYKAAYFLIGIKSVDDKPNNLIYETLDWLISQQREDGGFTPWKTHPINPNIFYTSLSLYAILCWYKFIKNEKIDKIIEKSVKWILNNQLSTGIWSFHEIEEGASWGAFVLSNYLRYK